MAKLTLRQFSQWLKIPIEAIIIAKQTVDLSDPDGAYTHLQDMGDNEAAEAVEAIWFEHGSWKEALKKCKNELGIIEELRRLVREVLINH